jgi:hypothetical protein
MNELLVFIALSLLKFKGLYYKANQTVLMTDEQAAPYLDEGLIRLLTEDEVEVEDSADVSDVDPSSVTQVNLLDENGTGDSITDVMVDAHAQISLLEAIAQLDPENGEHYTATGKPKADALSELLGREVSAAERDEAFATFTTNDGPE